MSSVYDFPEYYDILFGWDRDHEARVYTDAFARHGVDAHVQGLGARFGVYFGLEGRATNYRDAVLHQRERGRRHAHVVRPGRQPLE